MDDMGGSEEVLLLQDKIRVKLRERERFQNSSLLKHVYVFVIFFKFEHFRRSLAGLIRSVCLNIYYSKIEKNFTDKTSKKTVLKHSHTRDE